MKFRSPSCSQLRPSWAQLAPKWPSKSTQIRGLGLSWRGSGSKVDDQTCKTITMSSRDPLQAPIFTYFAIENHSIQWNILEFQQSIFQHSLKAKGPAAEALAIKSGAAPSVCCLRRAKTVCQTLKSISGEIYLSPPSHRPRLRHRPSNFN